MRSWRYTLLALGVILVVIAIFLMVEGTILGERTTGIATLLGILGMFTIIMLNTTLILGKSKRET